MHTISSPHWFKVIFQRTNTGDYLIHLFGSSSFNSFMKTEIPVAYEPANLPLTSARFKVKHQTGMI
ncbi:hypothetical protein CEF21_05140 [Bacillus sp. FJAT-42376]|nr:hypothetical protein CEF21_05140 [Bacillus sp. FJAT-42376]